MKEPNLYTEPYRKTGTTQYPRTEPYRKIVLNLEILFLKSPKYGTVLKFFFSQIFSISAHPSSSHMTGDKIKLYNASKYEGKQVVATANNSRLPITHIGDTVITSYLNQQQV